MNLFLLKSKKTEKIISGNYDFMGAKFHLMIIPEKISFFRKWRANRYIRRFEGEYIYDTHVSDIVKINNFYRTDGRWCMSENIEMLCRKICKNRNIRIPPSVGIYDSVFTNMGAEILKCVGRFCSEIYIFTKSRTAYSYIDYMLDEYGCTVCVKEEISDTDILITMEQLERSQYSAFVVDITGQNAHIMSPSVSEMYFSVCNLSKEDEELFGKTIDSRMYDFFRLSGMKDIKNVNFLGYG